MLALFNSLKKNVLHQPYYSIYRCFLTCDVHTLVKTFEVYITPTVEYASSVWSPSSKCFIDKIEKVQRRFTKRLRGFKHMTYGDRLKTLNILLLEYHRFTFDLAMCYKIVHELIDLTLSDFFSFDNLSLTRGHSSKLVK